MRVLIAMTMLTLTALGPAIASADQRGTRDPRVNTRQQAQRERIQ